MVVVVLLLLLLLPPPLLLPKTLQPRSKRKRMQ